MSVVLNLETAMMGYIIALRIAIDQLNENKNEYDICDVKIMPSSIIKYSNALRYAECGPIVKNFDENLILKLLNSKKELFVKTYAEFETFNLNCKYVDFNKISKSVLLNLLVKELNPYMNYPTRLLKYMMIYE